MNDPQAGITQNVVSVNHNQSQYSSNTRPVVGTVLDSSSQVVHGVPQNKSGSNMKSFVLISGIVLVVVCCVCTVCSFLSVSSELVLLDEQKKVFVSQLGKTVCEKSDSELSNTYRTRTLEKFRQDTTEAEFIEQAKKISYFCDYLESKSSADLLLQFVLFKIDGESPYNTGVNTMELAAYNYHGNAVFIIMVGNTEEGFMIEKFIVEDV